MRDPAWAKYTPVAKDNREPVDLHGVYVCGLNDHYSLKHLTNYQEVTNFDSPLYWCNYGVADNASQIIDYYEHLFVEYADYMKDRNFVVLVTPIFREDQPEYGGWRWHKWGQYIGDFEPKCEYLYNEQGIDYVWVFSIIEVEEYEEEDNNE